MNNNPMIQKALVFIRDSWRDEGLNLEQIAQAAGFSVSYFDRLFAQHTGKPVMEYVRACKLLHAARQLRMSDISILEAALETGYANPENFARAFQSFFGQSPSAYRAQNREKALQWKDSSTGTVLRLFETAFPQLERLDLAELLAALYCADPLRHAFPLHFLPTIDCAAYQLADGQWISVQEYRPEEVSIDCYDAAADYARCLVLAEPFAHYVLSLHCAPQDALPELPPGCEPLLCYDCAFTGESVDVPPCEVRELSAADAALVDCFVAGGGSETLRMVWEQKNTHGNYAAIRLFGLFEEGRMVACALPSFDEGYGMRTAEIGNLFLADAGVKPQQWKALWAWVMRYSLEQGYIPVNNAVRETCDLLCLENSLEMGYCLTGRTVVLQG